MAASSLDPDIQAAFTAAPTAPVPHNIDPDIAKAFASLPAPTPSGEEAGLDPKERIRRGLPKFDNSFTHFLADIPGSVAHGVGTLIDVGRNDVRVARGEPTIPYGSAESAAAALSAPFAHAPDVETPTTDPKETIRRGLPKLGDQGPLGQTLVEDVGAPAVDIGQAAASVIPFFRGGKPPVAAPIAAPLDTSARQSIGAAAATTDLSSVTPELRDAVTRAQQSGNVHDEALARHVRADTLPMPEGEAPLRLRKGQATQDAQQISDEKNLRADPDTQGILTDSINEQNRKLVESMGEIRRRATPDIVQRNNLEHGQANIDSIKTLDNAAVTDIRAKYKALADANGGAMPIDTGTAAAEADSALKKGYLAKLVEDHSVLGPIMERLRSGEPMNFEDWESATKALSEVQRARGSEGTAAGIIRNQFENMPLSAGAQDLRGLLNSAKAAAKRRFDVIEQNPAYKAAIEDNAPKDPAGLHVIGAHSPLADSFMDRYFIGNGPNASRAYVARMRNLMGRDPEFGPSIEAATLNKLRDSAGVDANGIGGFNSASYRNARNALDKKADVLMSPESAAHTQQLSEVAGDVNSEPKGASTNRSNTALTLQRFGAQAEKVKKVPTIAGELAGKAVDVGAAGLGPLALGTKKVVDTVFSARAAAKAAQEAADAAQALKDAKLKFATEATAPGAGIAKE